MTATCSTMPPTFEEAEDAGIDTALVETSAAAKLPERVEMLLLDIGGVTGFGNAAANLLTGNGGANLLEGRGGADLLEGRGGADTILGGEGGDSFVWRRGDGADRIEDFTPGLDRLVLPGFGQDAAGVLALATTTVGGTRLDLGGGDALFLAGIAKASLSAADFVL